VPSRSAAYARLIERAQRGPILLDAPVGAELVRRGVRWRKNALQTDADAVRDAHLDYLRAGADLVRTDTFGLNHRTYLDVFKSREHMRRIGAPGLETLAPRLLTRAVEVAREAVAAGGRDDAPVAGVVSPLEHVFRPDLVPDAATARAEHAELAGTLVAAGVDLLLLEAMTTLRELSAALEAAGATDRPVWVSLAVDDQGRLLGGESVGEAARLAAEAGAEALILTAAPTADVASALGQIGETVALRGIAPLCGRFDPPSWKFEFHPRFAMAPPADEFARDVMAAATGARVVGGWCGATPEHVAALRAAVDGRSDPVAAG
jgi:S-methylmethionine-dependent homocysteine/selenocysteine methylase